MPLATIKLQTVVKLDARSRVLYITCPEMWFSQSPDKQREKSPFLGSQSGLCAVHGTQGKQLESVASVKKRKC